MYIQVFNPKKKLLGEKGSLIIDDQALNYSKSTKVFYENEELDVCVLVEKWRNRVLDIASVFKLDSDGTVNDLHAYEVVNTADGAYIGSIFEKSSEFLDPWLPAVTDVALARCWLSPIHSTRT